VCSRLLTDAHDNSEGDWQRRGTSRTIKPSSNSVKEEEDYDESVDHERAPQASLLRARLVSMKSTASRLLSAATMFCLSSRADAAGGGPQASWLYTTFYPTLIRSFVLCILPWD
jgi:hypothetical protein